MSCFQAAAFCPKCKKQISFRVHADDSGDSEFITAVQDLAIAIHLKEAHQIGLKVDDCEGQS